jgi:uncharacterized surface protein with fasciclin (FAS1) repeats
MKQSVRQWAGIAMFSALFFAACHKDNSTPNPTPTPTANTPLQSYISGDTSLSIFNAAITKAGDGTLYGGTDSVTVLAPTNDAFRAAGISAASINNMSASAVDSLLRYHFINGSANLKTGSYNSYTSELGSRVYGYGGSTDSNYFNGAQATRVAVPGSTATVYRLNSTLGIPYGTGADYLQSDTSLSYFSEALTHSGINLSSDTGWTTVLAPTNSAFRTAGYNSLSDIDNADSATLRHTLMYHVLPGEYFTNSYNGLSSVQTSNTGSSINIGTGATGTTFTGAGNSSSVGFAGSNVLAGNNTIYQPINGVLTP